MDGRVYLIVAVAVAVEVDVPARRRKVVFISSHARSSDLPPESAILALAYPRQNRLRRVNPSVGHTCQWATKQPFFLMRCLSELFT